MSATPTQSRLWFVRRGETVRGPFPTALVKRYLILGRLRQTDELSLDRQAWQAVSTYPMFAPTQLAEDATVALAREDERKPGDRRSNEPPDNPYKERRSGTDRRTQESPELVEYRQRRARVVQSLKPARQSNRIPVLIALTLLAGIIISGFLFKPTTLVSGPACDTPAAPGVNWSNCRKEQADLTRADLSKAALRNSRLTAARLAGADLAGSDLAYADLVGADLSNAQLQGAIVVGTNLRQANLSSANLEGADLSYADLTGATLDGAALKGTSLGNAIWPDGKVCARGSLGTCQPR